MPNRVISFEMPNYTGLFRVTSRLRKSDREECFATRFHDDPAELAREVDGYTPTALSWLVCVNREPVASLGAVLIWPGHWNVWAFGTERWPQVVFAITRHIKRVMIPMLLQLDANTVCAYVHKAHTQACTWLAYLGAIPTPLPNWGKNEEDFVLYRWLRKNMLEHSDG